MKDDLPTREALRGRFLSERRALATDELARRGERLLANLARMPWLADARILAAFLGVRGEPDLRPWLDPSRLVIALPRTAGGHITMHRWRGEPLIPGPFRIPEPPPELPVVAPREVDLWLVPGVAFDPRGNRLGHGAGYYDRLLAGAPGRKIGVAWAFQVVDHVPSAPHDIPMDALVTDEGWHVVG